MATAGINSAASYDLQAFLATDPRAATKTKSVRPAAASLAADSIAGIGSVMNPVPLVAATTAGAAASNSVLAASTIVQSQSSMLGAMSSSLYDEGFTVMSRSLGRGSVMGVNGPFSETGKLMTGARSFSEGISALRQGIKAQVGVGTAIGAVVSVATNAYAAVKGQISKGEAAGNIATDTVGAALSSLGGAVAGGVATAALGAMGIAGLPLTLVGLGAAVAGGLFMDHSFRKTNFAGALHGTVARIFGGGSAAQAGPPPQPSY